MAAADCWPPSGGAAGSRCAAMSVGRVERDGVEAARTQLTDPDR